MADLLMLDTAVLAGQLVLTGFFFHRGNTVGLFLLSPTALYWINDPNVPPSLKIICWIVGGIGAFFFACIVPAVCWGLWRHRFRNRAMKAFAMGDFQQSLDWMSQDKKRHGASRDHYSLHAQVLNGMSQYTETLTLLDNAEGEGFQGTNLIWPRLWALCRLNRHSEALALLEKRITELSEIELEYVVMLIYYARVYVDLKQTENAEEVMHQVERWLGKYRHRLPLEGKSEILRVYEECKQLHEALIQDHS